MEGVGRERLGKFVCVCEKFNIHRATRTCRARQGVSVCVCVRGLLCIFGRLGKFTPPPRPHPRLQAKRGAPIPDNLQNNLSPWRPILNIEHPLIDDGRGWFPSEGAEGDEKSRRRLTLLRACQSRKVNPPLRDQRRKEAAGRERDLPFLFPARVEDG